MKSIVRWPRCRLRRASAIAPRRSLTTEESAECAMNRASALSASKRARVVFPVPGGPHKISDGIVAPPSINRRNTRPSPTRCSWPPNSPSVRGRMRSDGGAGVFDRASRSVASRISGKSAAELWSGIGLAEQAYHNNAIRLEAANLPSHVAGVIMQPNFPRRTTMRNLTSLSRRSFAKLVGAGAAAAVVHPGITWAEATATRSIPGTIVRLNSNENPYGPSPLALKAMSDAFPLVWRYPDEHADALLETLTKLHGVTREQIVLGDGSGEILKVCAEAFTGPTTGDTTPIELSKPTRGPALQFIPGRGKLIVADPTYEAIVNHARVNRAEVVKVPLNKSFAHDLSKMLAVANEGLIYICNPNNPTASITPKNEMADFIAKVPPKTMILVDEAYFHYADSPDYESVIPLVKDHPNLIVARTFSKIYGMAGLRCGYGIAQPETIKRMHGFQMWDSVNIMALAAASASLDDPEQVPNGQRLITEAKAFTVGELDKLGYKTIPSQANFIMFDCKRPVVPLIQAMKEHNVQVGRLFPALPNHMRLTIGKKSEMESFLAAFKQVTA